MFGMPTGISFEPGFPLPVAINTERFAFLSSLIWCKLPMMKTYLCTIVSILAVFPFAPAIADETKEKPVIEWEEIESSELAAKLKMGSETGEKWTANPESIALEFGGPLISKSGEKMAQSRVIRIHTKGEGVPKILNVILIDDGLFDDQVKTMRHRFALTRSEDGKWTLRKAFRSSENWK